MTRVSNRFKEQFLEVRPLESIVGFKAAEEAYNLLDEQDQIIIDLLCNGWTYVEIGSIFGAGQSWVSTKVGRMRFKLADSTLRLTLEVRREFRDDMERQRSTSSPNGRIAELDETMMDNIAQ